MIVYVSLKPSSKLAITEEGCVHWALTDPLATLGFTYSTIHCYQMTGFHAA